MTIILDGTLGETFPSWTTSTRPASPSAGQMGYNSTLSRMEYYNGSVWVVVDSGFSSTQYLITYTIVAGGGGGGKGSTSYSAGGEVLVAFCKGHSLQLLELNTQQQLALEALGVHPTLHTLVMELHHLLAELVLPR